MAAARDAGKTLYLERLNDEFVCWCKCERSLVSTPAQADCPWCGCGWLFTCITCGKAFTFARAVRVPETLDELVGRDLRTKYGEPPSDELLSNGVEWMEFLLQDVVPGQVYVYFDGLYVNADAPHVRHEGIYAEHDLPYVPQVRAMEDPQADARVLSDIGYWKKRRIERPDE